MSEDRSYLLRQKVGKSTVVMLQLTEASVANYSVYREYEGLRGRLGIVSTCSKQTAFRYYLSFLRSRIWKQ